MKNYYATLLVALSIFACKGDPGPAGPSLTGDIAGKVYLYADNGLPLQDKSGVQVSLEGLSVSSVTLSDGSWKLHGVTTGIHTIVFSKVGFMTQKYVNIQFVGGGTYYTPTAYIGQIPAVAVTQLKLTQSSTANIFNSWIEISDADSLYREVAILFDKSPIVVSSVVPYLFALTTYLEPDSTSKSSTLLIYDFQIADYGISAGTVLYARAFAMPRSGTNWFYNPVSDSYEVLNSGISFSSLDSVVVP